MTPREINLILDQLGHHKAQLDRIEDHARQTNGRVKKLELWKARMDGAKWALSWLPTVGTGVLSGVVVAVIAFLTTGS